MAIRFIRSRASKRLEAFDTSNAREAAQLARVLASAGRRDVTPAGAAVTHASLALNGEPTEIPSERRVATLDFVTGANSPEAIAVNATHIYWANSGDGSIGRSNLDGSGAVQDLIADVGAAYAIAIDGTYVYWVNSGSNAIGRALLDGSEADAEWVTVSSINQTGLAVDAGHVYYNGVGIGRVNIDGSSSEDGWIDGGNLNNSPLAIAVDATHVYWSGAGAATVARANIDGTSVDETFIEGLSGDANGLALDSDHIYMAISNTETIERANIDGSGLITNFIFADTIPPSADVEAVAVDSDYVYFADGNGGNIGRQSVEGDQRGIRLGPGDLLTATLELDEGLYIPAAYVLTDAASAGSPTLTPFAFAEPDPVLVDKSAWADVPLDALLTPLTLNAGVGHVPVLGASAFAPAPIPASTYGLAFTLCEVQQIVVKATGGTFTLSFDAVTGGPFDAQTTDPIPFDADLATVQAALEALSNVEPGDITLLPLGPGPGGNNFYVIVGGQYTGQDARLMTLDASGLENDDSSAVTGVQNGTSGVSITVSQLTLTALALG